MIKVITDSNTCLPPEIVERYHMGIVPILLIFGEETLRDGVDITTQEFYQRLRTADPLPKTSSPTPALYYEAFQDARASGAEGVVVITLSGKLSMSYNAAHVAAQDMGDFPVRVVDGRMATIAQGFVALTAAEAATRGMKLEAVANIADECIPKTGFAVMLDTLEYLDKGGRVPAIASLVGSAIGLNPVLSNKPDGTVGIIAPTFGRKAAINRILNEVERKSKGRHLLRLAVMHADALEEAKALKHEVSQRFDCGEVYCVELTPVMGAHAGPGVLGLAYQVGDLPTKQEG
jgi:DegV family protein with EDD domain